MTQPNDPQSGSTGDAAALDDLRRWVDRLAGTLGVDPAVVDVDRLLDLTRDVAHGVLRPAVPVTAYLMGYAAASSPGSSGFDAVAGQVRDQVAGWAAAPGEP